jgi:hypothetical protein
LRHEGKSGGSGRVVKTFKTGFPTDEIPFWRMTGATARSLAADGILAMDRRLSMPVADLFELGP